MEYVVIIVIAAVVFGICFLADRLFTKLFRSRAEHFSGLSVRLNKKIGAFGLILAVIGLAGLFVGNLLLLVGGIVAILIGSGLVVYYMTYSIFYDADTFLYTNFGKKTHQYRFRDIQAQQLYNNAGHTLIELYMADGNAVQLQSSMEGAYAFMDHAFQAWLRQTGKTAQDCPFHDPASSCWFPPVEG